MKKILFVLFVVNFVSGCSISFSENPDGEKFEKSYQEPDFSVEEEKVLNGEKL